MEERPTIRPGGYQLQRIACEWQRYARNSAGGWHQAQIEWLSGPIDGMGVRPKSNTLCLASAHAFTKPVAGSA